jgi:hypothetical protein
MKNLNLTSQVNQTETNENLNSDHLEFNEVVVYKEMADQSAVRMNLIQVQMDQLDEMLDRRQFVLKEIYGEIVK